ncbi:LacI family DNA-binding transcriptional regulator [Pseudemcibacter aquimaris]|uniref:LacI family DNA-binding transcriptional regulator n=1 Tax=Pseudemcibacter aquimaris TaxID=2857064 RepID=UPI002012F238|nr:LacI family DNA-binding transcriptional regulator [Pseudemcibacter aquimaris]MCC3860360.1 LacI family transcriptional regulator [Pseudemcibacter aquimaris]
MATIRDVSKLAGVSVATVSRTLSHPDKVTEKTRKKVHAAIEETDYKPDVLARNFRTRRSSSIVVLVPDIANPFFSRVIRGIEKQAQILGYSVLLGDTQGMREREITYTKMVNTSQADGIIQLDSHIPFEDQNKITAPIVNACDCVRGTDLPSVQLDNISAAEDMTDHLISLGHKNIAVISGPEEHSITNDRLSGHIKAMEKAGIHFDTSKVTYGDYSIQSGVEAAEKIFNMFPRPSAIFCMNDEMAIGAIHRAKQIGFSVPDDISITGFDNISFAEFCDPPLTTISQPAEEFGTTAMTMLYKVMREEELKQKYKLLPFELITRQSTGPAK